MVRGLQARLTALGVTKTVDEWERDSRSAVYGELILRRLDAGTTPEQAIATPTAAVEPGPTRFLAWGERKTLRDWADDPRCETSYSNLRSRVEDGWNVEPAISTPTMARTAWSIAAWGETKSMRAWERDERAAVASPTIVRRLDEGWDAERAISTPPDGFDGVSARGETKNLFAWSKDERAVVSKTCLRDRLGKGWSLEEAMTTPASAGPRHVKAWGETKSVKAWAADPRAAVCANGIAFRLERGAAPEEAISIPAKAAPRRIGAFGETKTIAEWVEDARCRVAKGSLSSRLDQGWEPERALTEALREHDGLTAWGETKGLREWTRDPRRSVDHGAIRRRLDGGTSPEAAISTPAAFQNRSHLTAFGESKSQTEWTRDPRCRVRLAGLRSRLASGMSSEAAITTPPEPPNRAGVPAWGRTARGAAPYPTST